MILLYTVCVKNVDKKINSLTEIYIRKEEKMENYICTVCGYVYNPEENDGIKFEDLPDDYVCPLCGVGKDLFEKQ